MGLFSVLNIGTKGLLVSQTGLQVTGHNIANANTEGYSRQEAQIEAAVPLGTSGNIILGQGVNVQTIKRVYDRFIDQKINTENQTLNQYKSQEMTLNQLEAVFNETESFGLSKTINDFFNGLQDVANNPAGQPERVALLSLANKLTSDFNKKGDDLADIRKNLNTEIKAVIEDINSSVSQVRDLNQKVVEAEAGNHQANDLRDSRALVLKKLGEKIDITSFEDSMGYVSVYSGGKPLVAQGAIATLSTTPNPDISDNVSLDDVVLTINEEETNITSSISNGNLKGLLDLRDTFIPEVQNDLDVLASAIVNELNMQHRQGYDLLGDAGGDFFDPLSVYSKTLEGSAEVTVGTISDNSLLTLDNYEIRFTSSSTFDIVNVTDDSTFSTGNAYTDGGSFIFEGISLTISGSASANDVISVNTTKDQSADMGVAITNPRLIAASALATTIPGDNTNVLAMANIREDIFIRDNTYSIEDFYNIIVSEVGTRSQSNKNSIVFESNALEQLNSLREGISGVNLEEEMANLLKFQRAFQASSKIISITNDMLDTLMSITR